MIIKHSYLPLLRHTCFSFLQYFEHTRKIGYGNEKDIVSGSRIVFCYVDFYSPYQCRILIFIIANVIEIVAVWEVIICYGNPQVSKGPKLMQNTNPQWYIFFNWVCRLFPSQYRILLLRNLSADPHASVLSIPSDLAPWNTTYR